MFDINNDVKEAMLSFLDHFKTTGISRYTGESVLQASEEVLGVTRRLAAANYLRREHVKTVLSGLMICGNARFREMFKLLLQNAGLGNVALLPGVDPNAEPIDQIEAIWAKAVETFDKLSKARKWNLAKKGGGHKNGNLAATVRPAC